MFCKSNNINVVLSLKYAKTEKFWLFIISSMMGKHVFRVRAFTDMKVTHDMYTNVAP